MNLKKIYQPVQQELSAVEQVLKDSLTRDRRGPIAEMSRYLLTSRGKRLRPALVLLSAKAVNGKNGGIQKQLIHIASAIELVHLASLMHDDVIDRAGIRHNRATVNFRWGQDVAIVFGDYIYSIAFGMISALGSTEVLRCISFAVKMMCEGELMQVAERWNLNLSEKQYIAAIKKKTASLFSASCQAGGMISRANGLTVKGMEEYGKNLGILFQITDDYLDIVGEAKRLGKVPGQDVRAGEITLPILKLWKSLCPDEKKKLSMMLTGRMHREILNQIRYKLFEFKANLSTKETALSFANRCREQIDILPGSPYKEGLLMLPEFIMQRGFNGEK